MVELESDHAIEVNLFTIAGREGIVLSEETQNLLLLLVPGQFGQLQVFDEALLVVSRGRYLSRRVHHYVHEFLRQHHGK